MAYILRILRRRGSGVAVPPPGSTDNFTIAGDPVTIAGVEVTLG